MKLKKTLYTTLFATAFCLFACDDDVTTLGNSLVNDNAEVVIDSTFTVTGHSVENDDIQSRTITQVLGSLTAKEYGHFSSDFVTQFMPAMKLTTDGVEVNDIDSIKLLMFYFPGDFTGDSIVPMGLKVYPLTRQLPSPIYSDFDPTDYYDENNCWTAQPQIYTGNALYSDSINNLSYRTVSVNLPLQFGREFFSEYLNSPQTFATPSAFAQFFPGLYIKNSFGSGRVINFNETRINLYYKRHAKVTKDGVEKDTVYNISSTYMAVTPEVVTNNIIDMSLSPELLSRIDNDETLIVAPASYDVEIEFPTKDIIAKYRSNIGDLSVINTLTFSIPVETIQNNYKINPPSYLLLVLSKDKKSFFANNSITDDKTSFLAQYNEVTKTYDYTGMRQYILDMLSKDEIKAEDYTFTLTPVTVVTENGSSSYYYQGQTYIKTITPYIAGPAMCRLNLEKAKIKFTYSKQIVNN